MKADNPKLFKSFKWALYPEVTPGVPAKVTIGGTDLAVGRYSQHKALAFQAALCIRDKQNQIIGANVGGVPPLCRVRRAAGRPRRKEGADEYDHRGGPRRGDHRGSQGTESAPVRGGA